MIIYVVLAIVAGFMLLGGVASCEHKRAEIAETKVEAQEKLIGAYKVAEAKTKADIAESVKAVATLKSDEAKRIAAGAIAQQQAAKAIAALEMGLQAQLAAKPQFPEDACKSACFALRQPLP